MNVEIIRKTRFSKLNEKLGIEYFEIIIMKKSCSWTALYGVSGVSIETHPLKEGMLSCNTLEGII